MPVVTTILFLACCFVCPIFLLLGGAVPSSVANRCSRGLAKLIQAALLLQCCLAITLAASTLGYAAWYGSADGKLISSADLLPGNYFAAELSVTGGAISYLMLSLVSFIGWAIACYGQRYLAGDQRQGRFYRWISLTLGAVSLMAVSGSLLLFTIAWCLASLGAHQLLLHYGDRSGARRAAGTKFIFSRIGEVALIGSLLILYEAAGTSQFSQLAALWAESGTAAVDLPATLTAAIWLIVLAVCIRSAQFPFHSWLPQTVETPTPVSALLHAGIVNAGGLLLNRLSPVLVQYSPALNTLALVGAATVVVGALAMLAQPSVKGSLAYSTIAQMGFMILQCGLGAFSASFLHILAHSLYKSYAFLASGSVISEQQGMAGSASSQSNQSGWMPVAMRVAVAAMVISVSSWAGLAWFSIDLASKPGGLVLCGIFGLALLSGLWLPLSGRVGPLFWPVLAVAAVLPMVYLVSYSVIDFAIEPPAVPSIAGAIPLGVSIVFAFAALLFLQTWVQRSPGSSQSPKWLTELYVHASNGFYIEAVCKRLFGFGPGGASIRS